MDELSKVRTFTCPTCGARFRAAFSMKKEYPYLPFCSERCKLVDLGAWLDEEYRISEPLAGGTGEDVQDTDDGGGDRG